MGVAAGVEHQVKIPIGLFVVSLLFATVEIAAERGPVAIPANRSATWLVPFDIGAAVPVVVSACQKTLAAEYRVCLAESDQASGEFEKGAVFLKQGPVEPAYFIVLAVSVVVASLCAPHFVAGKNHRHALAQEKRGEEVLDLAQAKAFDCRIVARALHAEIVAQVVVVSVPVILAVGLVVFLIVADQVVERETVVGGDEINRISGKLAA